MSTSKDIKSYATNATANSFSLTKKHLSSGKRETSPQPILLALALMLLASMATEVMAQTGSKLTCLPPPSGMVAWWPLDEPDPITGEYVDLAGGDNNGTGMGNPSQLLNQYIGDSLQAGIGKYVKVADAQNLNFGLKSFTIDARIKLTPGSQTDPIVFKQASTSGNAGGLLRRRPELTRMSGGRVGRQDAVLPSRTRGELVRVVQRSCRTGDDGQRIGVRVSRQFTAVCQSMKIRHVRIRPYTPRTNGKAEAILDLRSLPLDHGIRG